MKQWSDVLVRAGIGQRYHKWLFLALFLLIIRFLVMPLIAWQYEKVESIEFNRLQTRGSEVTSQMKASLQENLEQLKRQLNDVKSFYTIVENPQQAEIHFAQRIEKLATDAGLSVGSKSWQTLYSTDWFTRQKMDVQLEGNFKQLQEFVSSLESARSPIYLVIDTNISSARLRNRVDVGMEIHQLVLVQENDAEGEGDD